MTIFKGFIEKIVYRNEETGYCVASGVMGEHEFTLVGTLPYLAEGEMIEAEGRETEHPVYGEQFLVEQYHVIMPEDMQAVERYLGSGAIKGVGAALAARIVKKFKADTMRVLEEEPERLAEVKGISEKMAMEISAQVEARRGMQDALIFMQGFGISQGLSLKIYKQYGPLLYTVLKENPYKMAEDINGIGFKTCDEIAKRAGMQADSEYRIRCGILYVLKKAQGNGHVYLPREELLEETTKMLSIPIENLNQQLVGLQIDKKIVVKGDRVYLSSLYYMELNTATMLKRLNIRAEVERAEVEELLARVMDEEEISLDELQRQAVYQAVTSGVLIITGGPGTGKSATRSAEKETNLLHQFRKLGELMI